MVFPEKLEEAGLLQGPFMFSYQEAASLMDTSAFHSPVSIMQTHTVLHKHTRIHACTYALLQPHVCSQNHKCTVYVHACKIPVYSRRSHKKIYPFFLSFHSFSFVIFYLLKIVLYDMTHNLSKHKPPKFTKKSLGAQPCLLAKMQARDLCGCFLKRRFPSAQHRRIMNYGGSLS